MTQALDFSELNHPDKIAAFLQRCADQCHEAASECETSWQEKSAGRPWTIAARELERCASRITKALA